MSGLTRVTQVLFSTSGLTPSAGFGGPAAGNLTTENGSANTPANIMAGTAGAWSAGWLNATLGSSKFPTIEDMNSLAYVITYQLGYMLARGIPEYDSGTQYNIGDITRPAGSVQLWQSIANTNTGNALPSWPYSNAYWAPYSPSGRIKLSTNTSFYIATTGSDSTGTGAIGAPWKTAQHAVNYLQTVVDLNGFTASIQAADGTYTDPIVLSSAFTGGGIVQIVGNLTTPANCIISTTNASCVSGTNGALFSIGGFKLQNSGGGNLINTSYGSICTVNGNMNFGTSVNEQLVADDFSEIVIGANYTISGGSPSHYKAFGQGIIRAQILTITLTGTPAFSVFALANDMGLIICGSCTYSGSATGQRYNVSANSVIDTSGAGSTYLPGSTAGAFTNGGQYI